MEEQIKKEYHDLIENNNHIAAAILLVKNLGTSWELSQLRLINARMDKYGYIDPFDQKTRSQIVRPYSTFISKG